MKRRPLSSVRKTPLARHRQRLKKQGIVRVEVQVRKDDAALVRGVANALSDPAREGATRALLRERFGPPSPTGLKALLAAAPFNDIDLTRSPDTGRAIDL